MDGFNQPSPGIKTTRQINQMLCCWCFFYGFYQEFFVKKKKKKQITAELLNYIRNMLFKIAPTEWLKIMSRMQCKGGKNENGIFEKARLSV